MNVYAHEQSNKYVSNIRAAMVSCIDCRYPRAVAVKNVNPWVVVGDNPAKYVKMREIKKSVLMRNGGGQTVIFYAAFSVKREVA